MQHPFILSCGSTIDVPYSYAQERDLSAIFYTYRIGEQEYVDDMGRDPEALPRFYELIKEQMPQTSQINVYAYTEYFDKLLQKGDVLHIAFGSGMSSSVQNAMIAADSLREKHPDRKLVVIDSLCSSSGYGLLVDGAADLRDAGKSLDEVAQWVLENRNRVHHQFYSTDLKYFRRGGRVSGPAATIGAILNICPIMRLNNEGRIIAYDKVRGRQNAIRRTLDTMEQHAQGGRDYDQKCWICHSNSLADATATQAAIRERFPRVKELRICDIGTIIGSHTGPGTVAVFFFGDERTAENPK